MWGFFISIILNLLSRIAVFLEKDIKYKRKIMTGISNILSGMYEPDGNNYLDDKKKKNKKF